MSEDRRNIAPEFVEAVKRGLAAIGANTDPVAQAKALWTNTLIEVNVNGGPQTIANPHFLGARVDEVEATITKYW